MSPARHASDDEMDAATWCRHLVPDGSVYAFLADHRHQLFPVELFADVARQGGGHPSVPAAVVATVMVLQALEGVSDREAISALRRDIAWKVACGLRLDDEGFHPTVLVYWRARLQALDRPRRIFDAVCQVVAATGVLAGRRQRVLDSTVLEDAVATQDTVTQLVAAIRRVRPPGRGHSQRGHQSQGIAGTRAKACRLLRRILADAVEAGYLARNPCTIKGAGHERTAEMRHVNADQLASLADAFTPRYRALVLLAGYGGLRWGELAGLRRHHVDLAHATVTVVEQVSEVAGRFHVGAPKTETSVRTVTLPRVVTVALADHLERWAESSPTGLVFPAPRGGYLRHSDFRRRYWLKAVHAAELDGLRFHDLRHTAATLARAAGATTRELMARMGQSTAEVALRYEHVMTAGMRPSPPLSTSSAPSPLISGHEERTQATQAKGSVAGQPGRGAIDNRLLLARVLR